MIGPIPLILEFCDWLKEQKKIDKTITTYKRDLEKFQEWLQENHFDIQVLTKENIQGHTNLLEQQQKSVATIHKTTGAFRTFAKFLEKPELDFGIKLKPVEKNEDIETLLLDESTCLLKKSKRRRGFKKYCDCV